jgi:hypothetical protein
MNRPTTSEEMLALAAEYEAGTKKCVASGYEEFGPEWQRKRQLLIDALRRPAQEPGGRYVHIDNVIYHLDDIEVDKAGKCSWTDVANALTHIKLCVENFASPEGK